MVDKERFMNACQSVIGKEHERRGIGTLGEKTTHAVLKNYFEPVKENQEVRIGGYVADIVGENGVIEIQTAGFQKLLEKLEKFLEFTKVTVVYPVPRKRAITYIDKNTGEIVDRRNYTMRAYMYKCFPEIYRIKYTLDNPNFRLCLCLLDVEQIRVLGGGKTLNIRKRNSKKYDLIPRDIVDEIYLDSPEDYRMFIPESMRNTEFIRKDFAKMCHINYNTAGIALNILTYLGIIERAGKKGRNILYKEKQNLL